MLRTFSAKVTGCEKKNNGYAFDFFDEDDYEDVSANKKNEKKSEPEKETETEEKPTAESEKKSSLLGHAPLKEDRPQKNETDDKN